MSLIRIGDSKSTSNEKGGNTVRVGTLNDRSIVDSSIIERLQEAGYVIKLIASDNLKSIEAMLSNLGQYVWPSSIGNVPAFRDANGAIYVLTDRQQIFQIVTNVGPTTPTPTPTPTGSGNDVKPFTPTPTLPVTPINNGPVTANPIIPLNPPTPPGGIIGSGKIYNKFNFDEIARNQQQTVTRAMWTGDLSNLLEFHINPDQTDSQKKYYLEIHNTGSAADCAPEAQFSIAFGNKYGSGSEDQGVQVDDTPTRAIYGQYRLLCLNGEKETFTIGGKSVESIYVININRSRFREWVDEGNLQLNLQALTGWNYDKSANNGYTGNHYEYTGSNVVVEGAENVITIIDDSKLNDPELTSAGEVHQLVSGSLENYQTNGGVHLVSDNPIVYGLLYKRLGVMILDAEQLDDNLFFGTVIENSSGGGEIEGDNVQKLFTSMSGSAIYTDGSGDPYGFQARSAEVVKSTHFFCRLKNSEYNFSNNPTFTTGSDGDLAHPTMINDPKVYVTTVGLYNTNKELVAVAKLSKPFQKHFARETVVRVKLEY